MSSTMKWPIAPLALLVCLTVAAPMGGAQTQPFAGKWHFVLQTEGGDRTADPNFQLDGERVTGRWGDADVKGTFSGGKLDLSFPYNSDEAGPGTLKIKGELKGETLVGTWEFQEYTGTFKATRPPATQ
jgi:hypothetical protein